MILTPEAGSGRCVESASASTCRITPWRSTTILVAGGGSQLSSPLKSGLDAVESILQLAHHSSSSFSGV
jgi:hypothetical protein